MEGEPRSTWISRFFKSKEGGSVVAPPRGSMRRSFSCSSVPSQTDSDFMLPRAFQRSQVADYDDELLDDESFRRFLLSSDNRTVHCSSQEVRGSDSIGTPREPRPLSVSLDRGTFLSSGGSFTSNPRTSSTSEVAGQRIIRGFEEGGGEWTLKLQTDAPLPYSSFEDQQSGRKAQKARGSRRGGSSASPGGLFREFGYEHRTGLASLLTPILKPIKSWQSDEASASSNNAAFFQVHQARRRASKKNDEFVHEESVLTRRNNGFLDKQQQQQQQQQFQQQQLQQVPHQEWINRWSVSGDEISGEANVVRLRAACVPSAEAMAIVGKSSLRVHPNSSWSNSITSWQSDASSKQA